MEQVKEWFWSYSDEGPFYGPCNSRDDAIQEARHEDDEEHAIVYVGQSHKVYPEIDADQIIDQATEDLYERAHEDAVEHWCVNIPEEQKKALSDELSAVFIKHLNLWGEKSEWDVISDPEEIDLSTYKYQPHQEPK